MRQSCNPSPWSRFQLYRTILTLLMHRKIQYTAVRQISSINYAIEFNAPTIISHILIITFSHRSLMRRKDAHNDDSEKLLLKENLKYWRIQFRAHSIVELSSFPSRFQNYPTMMITRSTSPLKELCRLAANDNNNYGERVYQLKRIDLRRHEAGNDRVTNCWRGFHDVQFKIQSRTINFDDNR